MDIKETMEYELEKRSSAVSLSDMEIFVFPDLMFSLVLANIMSPRIWKWLENPWFKDIDKQKPLKKIKRLRQYIMDNYTFNLDLDTWGLTTKEEQLDRFKDYIDPDILSRSNALFGYEGDKYYFDIDIRRHFGLDKYTTNVIPYWKTETVEAMDAFKYKEGYTEGAGECVSLSALWAAALYIICKIPLNQIYLMGTPLHSQNFVIELDGFLTNNRRIVTPNMWVNGTELSAKARRALENEQVTIVSHITGHAHVMYEKATIDPKAFNTFKTNLEKFLSFHLTTDIFCNFLRYESHLQKYFQVECPRHSQICFIALERLFAYEHTSAFSIIGPARKKLLETVDPDELHCSGMPGRLNLNTLEKFLKTNRPDLSKQKNIDKLKAQFDGMDIEIDSMMEKLIDFCITRPRLPQIETKKLSEYSKPINIQPEMTRDQIITHLEEVRQNNPIANYAFYTYRDLNKTDPEPFLKAAIQRNPVSLEKFKDLDIKNVIQQIHTYKNESIYDDPGRLAQPDEVFNYKRGDGVEKAILLANVIHNHKKETVQIKINSDSLELTWKDGEEIFQTNKKIKPVTWNF